MLDRLRRAFRHWAGTDNTSAVEPGTGRRASAEQPEAGEIEPAVHGSDDGSSAAAAPDDAGGV